MARAWLAIVVVMGGLLPAAAGAATYKVLNCTNTRIEAWSYNETDIVRAVPFKVTVMESRGQGVVECATDRCATLYRPVGAPELTLVGNSDFCLVYWDGAINGMIWSHFDCQPGRCGTIQ